MDSSKQFAKYLKQHDFNRFIETIKEKYRKTQKITGKVTISNLTSNEKYALELLFGTIYGNDFSMTIKKIYDKLKDTIYKDIDFIKVLEEYYQEPIKTKAALRNEYNELYSSYIKSLYDKYANTKAYQCLEYIINDRSFKALYNKDKEELNKYIIPLLDALNDLPIYSNQYLKLALFSQKITKDPHFFDHGICKEWLIKAIAYLYDIPYDSSNLMLENEILSYAGIFKDDLSNYCSICHIHTESIYDRFYDIYEPLNINLHNVLHTLNNYHKQVIFIIENPSVFSELCSFIKEHHINVGLICSFGQINYCTYKLIEQLLQVESELFYAGDYDPEGLMIADRLLLKYPAIKLWLYDDSLLNHIAIRQEDISDRRITMLKNLCDMNLYHIGNQILDSLSFGYQEGLIDYYKEYLLRYKK